MKSTLSTVKMIMVVMGFFPEGEPTQCYSPPLCEQKRTMPQCQFCVFYFLTYYTNSHQHCIFSHRPLLFICLEDKRNGDHDVMRVIVFVCKRVCVRVRKKSKHFKC